MSFLKLVQGGILWFQNLTELPNGTLGSILPLLAAGLYFANVKVFVIFSHNMSMTIFRNEILVTEYLENDFKVQWAG